MRVIPSAATGHSEPFASLRVNSARNLSGSRKTSRAARGDHAGWSQVIGIRCGVFLGKRCQVSGAGLPALAALALGRAGRPRSRRSRLWGGRDACARGCDAGGTPAFPVLAALGRAGRLRARMCVVLMRAGRPRSRCSRLWGGRDARVRGFGFGAGGTPRSWRSRL
jgi:hypothetical protein